MDRFKLEIFKKESEKDFTFYKTLSMEESSSFLNELSVQFHVQCENFNILQNIGEPREDMNAASDEFQVERLFTKTNHPDAVSYTHLTLPTKCEQCRSRWSPYH